MKAQEEFQPWIAFQAANSFRRAIRKFNSTPIAKEDVQVLLAEAVMAPSSGNLQPYQLHWIRDPSLKAQVALACNGQNAAASAAEIVVIVASPGLGKRTVAAQLQRVEASGVLDENAKIYHRKQLNKFRKIMGIGASAL